MRSNIVIVIIVGSLILGTQVTALFAQYKVNKFYKGINYWLLGISLMVVSFILMPFVTIDSLKYVALFSNPILILGHIYLYLGIKTFLNQKINKIVPVSIFISFNSLYYYFLFINNIIAARTVIISITLVMISFLIAYELLFKHKNVIGGSRFFNAGLFFIYGAVNLLRIGLTLWSNPENSYSGQSFSIIASIMFAIVISNLWTFGLIIMVNQRLATENELEKQKLELIFNTSTNAQLITRLEDSFIVNVNDEFTEITGYTKDEVMGKFIIEMDFWKDLEHRKVFSDQLKKEGICKNMETIFKSKDGSQFDSIISARTIIIDHEVHIISVVRDITQRKKFERTIIESEEKYRSILNASPDDITITDLSGNILIVSPAAKDMFGYDLDHDIQDMKLLDFIAPKDRNRAEFDIMKLHRGIKVSTNEYQGISQDQAIIDIEVNSGFIYNVEGAPDKIVYIVRDITKRKSIEAKLANLITQLEIEKNTAQLNAITDSLTGLFNRGHFDKILGEEFSSLEQSAAPFSLIMLDIDHFKKYNDIYGHVAGDKVLQMVSTTLRALLKRPIDLVARYGGEEFIVILPNTSEIEAKSIGEEIRRAIEELAITHMGSLTANSITISAGIITVYPGELESTDQVLNKVDDALYQAKAKGRNCWVFSPSSIEGSALA